MRKRAKRKAGVFCNSTRDRFREAPMRDGCCLFKSRRYGFQIVGANLNRYVLVNQLN